VCATTADLAKRERESERASLRKKYLKAAEETTRQCRARLRELFTTRNAAEQKRLAAIVQKATAQPSKKRVLWKDGFGTAVITKDRSKLEEVFTIPAAKRRKDNAAEDDDAAL